MLGLGNALFTAGSTSEQLYSLSLDGTGDYLSIGNVLNLGTADFSLSAWVKAADLTNFHVLSKFEDANNEIRLGTQGDDKLYWKCIAGGNTVVNFTAGSAITSLQNTWVHVCVTADRDGNGVMYVNGATTLGKTAADMFEDTQNLNNDGSWHVGRIDSSYVTGLIDEVAIWNVALDADAVAAVYNSGKPFNLNNDRGSYDNSSALQGYWRMGNGPFDDIANGAVLDAHNPGFADAANYLTTSWAVNTGGWNTTTGGIVNSGTNGHIRQSLEFSDYIGDVYKLEYTLSSVTDSTILHAKFGGGSSQVITGTAGNHIHYLTNDATLDNFQFSSADSWAGTITNISLRRLNGHPGLTAADATFSTDTPDDQAMSNVMTLDGTGDYLTMGTASSLKGFSAITVSFWAQIDVNQGNYDRFLDFSGTTNDRVFRMMCDTSDPDKLIWATWDQSDSAIATVTSSNALPLGSWVHCVGTWDGTTTSNAHKLYINNSTSDGGVATASNTNDLNNDAAAELTIGADKLSNSNYLAGRIDEVAIWNVALDADAIAAVYSAGRGYSLTSDTGNYDNASSLQGYWRMGDGADDDVANGVIHDQNNPGYGSELWDGTQGDDANWTVHGSNTTAEDDDAVKVTYVDNGDGAYIEFRDAKDLNTDLTVGATYRCTADVKTNTGSIQLSVRHGSSNTNSTSVTSTNYVNREIFFVCEHATDDRLEFNAMGGSEIGWVRNISLKKLNGYPGLTAADAAMIKQAI